MWAWLRSSAARRKRGQRGAVAVEAALVTPILALFVFGILEFSFALKDYVAITSSTRVGARMASASPGAGPSICDPGETASTSCNNANAPQFAKMAANAIQQTGSALNKDQINYLFVYKANDKGYPGATGNTTMPPTAAACTAIANCVVYTWIDSTNKFTYSQGTWTSSNVNACVANADSVGVYLNATHHYFTGMFGASVNISDRAIMRFEPLPTTSCQSGTHQ